MDTILIKSEINDEFSRGTNTIFINYQFFYTNQRKFYWKVLGKHIFRTLLKIKTLIIKH